MSEGIEFLLELQANIEGATKMVRELTKVESATKQTDAALKQAEKQTGLLGRAMHKGGEWAGEFGHEVGSSFTGMFSAMAAWDGVKEGIHLLFELGGEALHAAGEAERLRLTFRNMMGVEMGDDTLDYLDQVAKHTEFTDGELKGFAQQLIRAGYSGDELKRALGGVIDMAAKSGDALGGAAAGVELLARMNLKGGLSSRELVSAGISPKKLYTRLAGELGIGVKAVEEQLQQGKIKAEILREAFYAELVKPGANLGDAGVAMSETFEAKLKKAKDIIPNLFEELEKSDGLKGITFGLSQLAIALDPGAPAGKKIVAGLEHLLNWFGAFIASVDFEKFSDRVVAAMGFIENAIEYGAAAFEVLSAPIRLMYAFNEALVEVYKWLGGFFGEAYDVIKDGVGPMFNVALDVGAAIVQGIWKGLTGGASQLLDAITGIGTSIVERLKGVLGIHSPSRVFAKLGLQTAAGFQLGIEAGTPDVSNTVEQAFGAPPASDMRGAAPEGGSGSRSITIDRIEVNLGAVGDRSGREVAAEVAVSLRDQLLSLLEQLDAEGAGA